MKLYRVELRYVGYVWAANELAAEDFEHEIKQEEVDMDIHETKSLHIGDGWDVDCLPYGGNDDMTIQDCLNVMNEPELEPPYDPMEDPNQGKLFEVSK